MGALPLTAAAMSGLQSTPGLARPVPVRFGRVLPCSRASVALQHPHPGVRVANPAPVTIIAALQLAPPGIRTLFARIGGFLYDERPSPGKNGHRARSFITSAITSASGLFNI